MPAKDRNCIVRFVRLATSWPRRLVRSAAEYRFLRRLGFDRNTAWSRRWCSHEYLRNRPTPRVREGLVAFEMETAARLRSSGRASNGSTQKG
ncbi:MAG: hypothetical protein ABFD89_12645 [Bryobacteraceae bacterium]